MFVSSFGSRANWAKVMFSSFRNLPPNHENGEMASTPGMRSMIGLWRAGNALAMETLLRTTTRNAAPTSSAGTVISRKKTSNATSRNKLTATLVIESAARRLLRKAFLTMKVPTVMRSVSEFAFLQMNRARAVAGGFGIVGDEDHGFANVAAQALQDR